MGIAYLGLGSNLGDRGANCRRALQLMEEQGITLLRRSSMIETDPVGGPPQGRFLNMAVKVHTDVDPFMLLQQLKFIERELGRVKIERNGPRTIDIDILVYDRVQFKTSMLTLPHPRILQRYFVLRPLAEIDPFLIRELAHAYR